MHYHKGKIMIKKIIPAIITGKLTLSSCNVYAAGLGKSGTVDTSPVPELTLSEIGSPFEIITPPDNSGGSKIGVGVIYTNLASNKRIDFIIEGIRNDIPVHVFLAYSKNAGKSEVWPIFSAGQGQLELDNEGINIISGVKISPIKNMPFPETSLGKFSITHETVIMPLHISNLQNLGEDGEKFFFQAISIPLNEDGEYVWSQAQATEVDSFVINRSSNINTDLYNDGKSGGSSQSGSGSKSGGSSQSGSGSKSGDSSQSRDSGGK
jgi:uncharacterized membrane protein YgcG